MKVVFKSENGFSPKFTYNGTRFYLLEEEDIYGETNWALKSQKVGFSKKKVKVNPYRLLNKFFKNKKFRLESRYHYRFYYYKGKVIATDGEIITIKWDSNYERPYFNSYIECLQDAKEYIQKNILVSN